MKCNLLTNIFYLGCVVANSAVSVAYDSAMKFKKYFNEIENDIKEEMSGIGVISEGLEKKLEKSLIK
jgi:hypothetical protein